MFERLYSEGCRFIPVEPEGKAPASAGTTRIGPTHATRDRGVIARWRENGWGLAVVGGAADGEVADPVSFLTQEERPRRFLTILDVDVNKSGKEGDPDGFLTLDAMTAEYGELPPTLTAKTPSGGRHMFFWSPEDLGSYNDAMWRKLGRPSNIDVKARNGYVVIGTRVHPEYEFVDESPVAELPPDWTLFLKSLVGARHQRITTEGAFSSVPYHATVEAFNEENSIHDVLKRFDYVQTAALTYTHPFEATTQGNVCIMRNTNYITRGAKWLSYHWGAHDEVKRGPHDPFDVYRLLGHGGNWERAVKAYEQDRDQEECVKGGVLVRPSAAKDDGAVELVQQHLWSKDICMLSGASESYKTFWILDMAFSMATGVRFLNRFLVRHPIKSLLVLTESNRDFQDRLEAWLKVRGAQTGRDRKELLNLIDENVLVYFRPLQILNAESLKSFEQLRRIYDFQPQLEVYDHFSSNWGGNDENSNAECARYINGLQARARALNVAIVVVHHPSKSQTALRGAAVLRNNVPVVYEFESEKDVRSVRHGKCSYYTGLQKYSLQPDRCNLYQWKGCIDESTWRTGLALNYSEYVADGDVRGGCRAGADGEHKSLKEQHQEVYRGQLMDALTKRNQRLTQDDVMKLLKCSRPIARYTLKQLMGAGMVGEEEPKIRTQPKLYYRLDS